jgi:hypothetical protein
MHPQVSPLHILHQIEQVNAYRTMAAPIVIVA